MPAELDRIRKLRDERKRLAALTDYLARAEAAVEDAKTARNVILRKLYADGASVQQIADAAGLSKTAAYAVVRATERKERT